MDTKLILLILMLLPYNVHAWGRRGHQIVAETAALLVSEPDSENGFMRGHSFDLAYYSNVPDFMWKKPATYATEKPQHFMDMEIFDREFAKHPEIKNPFDLSRQEFEAKFPEIKPEAGRSFWRIRELYAQLEKLTHELHDMKEQSGSERHRVQLKWLVTAGTMSHYVGDLSMPLHVSENYDGQMTNQKGIHGYYEETVVDQLYPRLNCEVNEKSRKDWPAFTKKNKDKSVVELLLQLTQQSREDIPKMLALDKKSKREELAKNAKMYEPMIRKGLEMSSLTLAELYRRQLGWKFDDVKFYLIDGEPEYIAPGKPAP